MKILADASLPDLIALFPPPFQLTLYQHPNDIPALLPDHEVLLCRSTLRVTDALLANSTLRYVGTASSGVDHIDQDALSARQIRLFDAKGCNATAVADYVTATMAWLEQHQRISGQKAGIIGRGAVGSKVLARLQALQYNVTCYDPYQANHSPIQEDAPFEALMDCDVLCIHPNLHHQPPYPSYNLIDHAVLRQLKPGVVIINASRGGVVNESALLEHSHPLRYCTDVFLNEPNINPAMIELATLCTPHIAGHSIEAKRNAVIQLSEQLHHELNLPAPMHLPVSSSIESALATNAAWRETILAIYNPEQDTQILKQHPNKREAFEQQRLNHTIRHDFNYYTQNT